MGTPPDVAATAPTPADSVGGYVTTAALLATGTTRHGIRRAHREGRLVPVGSGLHLAPGETDQDVWKSRVDRAVVQAGAEALAFRFTAARILQIAGSPSVWPIELAIPQHRKAPQLAGVDITRSDIAPADIEVRCGLPTTAPLQTAVDCARSGHFVPAVCVIESACRGRLLTMEELLDRLEGMRRCPGIRAARRAVGAVDLLSESPLETALRLLLIDAGLPRPVSQLRFDVDGWRGRADLAYPAEALGGPAGGRYAGLVLEADGREPHLREAMFHDDRVRQIALEEAGWLVRRFTDRHIHRSPAYVVRTTQRAIAAVVAA